MGVAVGERLGGAGRFSPAAPAAPATWILAKGAGDSWWRAEAPARVLGATVASVPERQALRAFTTPNADTAFPWSISVLTADGARATISTKAAWERFAAGRPRYLEMHAEFPGLEGAAVWTRPDPPRAALALAMQEQGIRTLAETDDNYFAAPTQNLFLRDNDFSSLDRMNHAKAFGMMDGCVFSTAALRDIYAKELRSRLGKRNVPELFVCRNAVPRSDWPERVERDGPLRVGFMGSPSHVWDVNLAYAAFSAAHTAGCETVMIGYSPADPDPEFPDFTDVDGEMVQWRSDKSLSYKEAWAKVVGRHIRWVAPEAYHRAALPLDIGLCPLRADGFTAGKSDSKAIEYAISGAACVLQNVGVYNSAGWEDGVNCLMAGSPEDFAVQTYRLIRDEKLRFELVSAAQEMIASERNEDTMRGEWMEAIHG